MADSVDIGIGNFFVEYLDPDLKVKGPLQEFNYGDYLTTLLELKNKKQPVGANIVKNGFGFTNYNESGFVAQHETSATDTAGRFAFYRKLNGNLDAEPIYSLNDDGTFNIYKDTTFSGAVHVPTSTELTHAASVEYANSVALPPGYLSFTAGEFPNATFLEDVYFNEGVIFKASAGIINQGAHTLVQSGSVTIYQTETTTTYHGILRSSNEPEEDFDVVNKLFLEDSIAGITSLSSPQEINTPTFIYNWNNAITDPPTPYILNHVLKNSREIHRKISSDVYLREWSESVILGDANSFNPRWNIGFYHSFLNMTVTPLQIYYNGHPNSGTITTDCTLIMSGKKITDVGDAVDDSDVPNFVQVKDLTTSIYGSMYFENNAVTTGVSSLVYTKMNGTTTYAGSLFFSQTANNQMTYIGTKPITAFISINLSCATSGTASIFMRVYRNGVAVTPSTQRTYEAAGAAPGHFTVNSYTTLSTGDYLELYITSGGSFTLTPSHYNMCVHKI